MSIQDLWYGYKFFRSILTEREKKIYDQIYKGIMNWQNAIPLVGVSPEQGKKIINAILADNPMFFHVDSFTFSATLISCTINPIYCMTKLQYSAYAPQLETAVYAYADRAQSRGVSTLDIIQRLHDLISREMRYYDDGMTAHTVIGPLMNKQGVCEGISKSIKLVCDRLGVPSAVIFGTALSQTLGAWENHAWNMIKIDESWRYFDFTYDLTLNTTNPCSRLVRYDYFALSFDEISSDHRSDLVGLPLEHRSSNYFLMHNLIVRNQQDLSRLIAKTVSGNNKDIAFQASKTWSEFSPETELQKAFSLRTVIATGFSVSYSFSYNDMQRVCYVHFN